MDAPRRVAHFAGVLGWPLEKTLSPTIHNAAFRRLGLEWVYMAWPVPPGSLAAAVGGLRALGASGANVTMPHKEAITEHLDELSGDGAEIGAINTIQRVDDLLVGHNTDVDGFSEFLIADVGVDVRGMNSLVLGAGGAARAVVVALYRMGAASVTVAARRSERAEAVAAIARGGVGCAGEWGRLPELVRDAGMVVNATSLGAGGEDPAPGIEFRPDHLVVDLVYDPPSTPLIERARAAGADAWSGLGMLLHQAAASFRMWTGQVAPLEEMSAAAVHALGARGGQRG
ncbi:MAG: shikimate dehydrogenase [Actinomycetota bacterium]